MKKAIAFATLLLAIGWSISPTDGFIPNGFLQICAKGVSCFRNQMETDEEMITHEDMTKKAILEVAAQVLQTNTNPRDGQSSQRLLALSNLDEASLITAYYGLSDERKQQMFKNAVEQMLKATAKVDYPWSGEDKLAAAHFDAEQFESGQNRLIALRQSVVTSIQVRSYDAARRDMGRMLHTLQDFYSHSNWVENGNQAPNPVLGQPGKIIENVADREQQTCTDCEGRFFHDCYDNIVESLKDNGILTSGYVGGTKDENGERIKKFNGKCSHGGLQLTDSEQNLPARGGINKDSPYQMLSPHYYLHYKAVALALQATIDMLRDLRRDVNNDQLFGEYLGVFESQAFAANSGICQVSCRKKNRNAMLQRHWNRIEELHADSAKLEDVKAIVDEIAGLMAKIERLHKRGFRAEQQVLAVAERAASKQESKNLRMSKFSGVAASNW